MSENNIPENDNIENVQADSGNLSANMDLSDSDGFVDFIDQNFEEIKIAGCTRDSCFIWVCK